MDSLVGYGSDDEVESDRYGQQTVGGAGMRRREDDTNYDSVNMDMSEDSQAESEPELPPADGGPPPHHDIHQTNDGGDSDRSRDRDGDRARDDDRPRDRDGDRLRDRDRDRDWRRDVSRRDDRPYRSDRSERRSHDGPRRGLLGDRPDDRPARLNTKYGEAARSHDARDAVSPRFVDRERGDRRERDKERDRSRDRDSDRARDRDGDRHRDRDRDRDSRSRHSEDRRSGRVGRSERSRSRSRGAAFPPPPSSDRHSPGGDYRPSYKVNRKLEVMEKMGLQIKTPDGSMATARELRAAAGGGASGAAGGGALGASGARVLQQVQRRKLLWAHKGGADEAAKWSGTRFAQDSDGRQVSKFMRLMGIKDPAALEGAGGASGAEGGAGAAGADPTRKQEELFQAMQAQYDVARATTHTMRGVGLGFTRNHF
ncbi:arginine/serine-rich coiled-coil protein 2 [Aricia agestis]|uniref:arginine/serine-rich coiled-coil protein 2 n=1 Tax=Aricia agestis TaxID=91739 RepID=UPI001C20BEF0|nr:arginine/serine-rich coiled-coil protein 2 [Aricia agestis]